ncbi:MAG: anthranilate synthase component I family protein [Crocinitomicaceae bacterium]|nr:anthranilate synthase component I family protein [Crocinitomicaceae bacterium]
MQTKEIHNYSWQQMLEAVEPNQVVLLKNSDHDFILAWNFTHAYQPDNTDFSFSDLQQFIDQHTGKYIFGYLTYDIKNNIEPFLQSKHDDVVQFPICRFFVTENVVVRSIENTTYYGKISPEELIELFGKSKKSVSSNSNQVALKESTSQEEYIRNIQSIQHEIQQGNLYETNYCIQYTGGVDELNTSNVFSKLNQLADAPFSVYMQDETHAVMCASPERYICKKGNTLISQPIKGTAKRGENTAQDDQLKKVLERDAKERSENIMIVDLVRNDFSKIALKNSVNVDELCKVYSFKTVHQLISTISCKIDYGTSFTDVIKATFPMGSMTGAPKIAAMQLTEKLENFKRGLYSGTIGYIEPNGDYDFNVVIRSILHNRKLKTVSCSVGSAITIHADAAREYEECMLKLRALQLALT